MLLGGRSGWDVGGQAVATDTDGRDQQMRRSNDATAETSRDSECHAGPVSTAAFSGTPPKKSRLSTVQGMVRSARAVSTAVRRTTGRSYGSTDSSAWAIALD